MISTKVKILEPIDVSDCVACTLRPLLSSGSCFGISPIRVNCPHGSDTQKYFKETFEICPKSIFRSIVILIIINFVFVNYFLVEIVKEENAALRLAKIEDATIYVGGTLCSIFCMVKIKQRLSELNGLDKIIKRKKYYQIGIIFDDKFIKAFSLKVHLVNTSFAAFILLYASVKAFYNEPNIHQMNTWIRVVVEVSAFSVITFTQIIFIFHYLFMIYLYKTAYSKCFERVKKILNVKLLFLDNRRAFTRISNYPLEVHLKKLNQLFCAITNNYRQSVYCINPLLLVCWMFFTITLITSFYLMFIFYDESNSFGAIIEGMKCLELIGNAFVYVHLADQLNYVKNELLPYLRKYPISKLSFEEAAQVEMLIQTLNLKKTTLRASDIVNIGQGLLASIGGTVITYLLIAVQFHLNKKL